MFGELPKLFGRDFAIGFLLPIAVFIPASVFVINEFRPGTVSLPPQSTQGNAVLLGATVFIFALWLGGILLLALNTTIIRFKEGYGKWNPARFVAFLEHRRFQRLTDRIQELEYSSSIAETLKEEIGSAVDNELDDLYELAAVRFPHAKELLLPTAFGNTVRAFEAYSFVVYRIDAIPAWPRLLMVMPESSRALVESEKAQMDFWLNVWFLSLLLLGQYLLFAAITGEIRSLWPQLALPVAWIASLRARRAAGNWGELVKASFDIYLPKLREALGFGDDLSRKDERDLWEGMSQVMIYRDPEVLPERVRKGETSSANGNSDSTDQEDET